MKQIRLTAAFALCALLGVTGCAHQNSESSVPVPETTAPAAETTASTTAAATTTEITTTTAPAPWKALPAKQMLDALQFDGQVSSVFDAGNGRAVILNYPAEGLQCHYVDWAAGKELSSFALRKSRYDDYVVGVTSDGRLAAISTDDSKQQLWYYDLMTGSSDSVTISTEDEYTHAFYLDKTTDQIYAVRDSGVFRMLDNGTQELVIESTMRYIYGEMFDAENGTIYFQQYSSNDMTGTDYVGYRLSDGKEISRLSGMESDLRLSGNRLLDLHYRYVYETEEDFTNCFVMNSENGRIINTYLMCASGMPQFYVSSLTGSAIQGEPDDETGAIGRILLSNPGSGTYADLDVSYENVHNLCAVYLAEAGRWLVACTSYTDSTAKTALFTVDPSGFRLTEQFPEADPRELPETPDNLPPLGEDYAENRKKADQIEKDFGVRVLIGNEVLCVSNSEYRMVSTEEEDYQEYDYYYADTDRQAQLSDGLDFLREQLARYPKGFLEKFKASNGTGGLRFSITRALPPLDETRSFNAGGLQFETGSWYEIAFNLYMMSGDGATLHHEIWHATEDLMSDNGVTIDYEYWNKLNPDGFSFDGVDNYGEDDDKYKYILNWSDDPYFVESYSTATEMEDRSTIVERIFSKVYEWDDIPYATNYEYLMSFPHIKAKIVYLESLLQKYYGYVYWKEIPGLTRAE